jgi:hypothetical protein
MAERRPFRTEPATVTTPKTAEETASPNPGTFVRRAKDGGGYLPTPSSQPAGTGHGHSPEIAWPKDKPVEHKPFRTKE